MKCWRKKIWANFQRNKELFSQKFVTKPSKIWVWDPGSEIRDPRSGIRDPGFGKNLSRIRIRNTELMVAFIRVNDWWSILYQSHWLIVGSLSELLIDGWFFIRIIDTWLVLYQSYWLMVGSLSELLIHDWFFIRVILSMVRSLLKFFIRVFD